VWSTGPRPELAICPGSEGQGLRKARTQTAIVRAAIGAVFALAFSACQTSWPTQVLHDGIQTSSAQTASVADRTVAAPSEMPTASAPLDTAPALRGPSLEERIAALLVVRAPDMLAVDRARVAGAIVTAQRNHRVDPLLVLAVIQQESRFISTAHGPRNSIGLMQVRPFVAADVAHRHNIPWSGAKTLLDPAANVQIGACYLGEMLEMYHDPALAIAAYNMGPYRVQRLVAQGRNPRPPYLISVLKHFQAISSEFGELGSEPIEEAAAE
ncbi:MAG: transglycosylase SLT domain-containing protein, partial [bacterium]